MSAHNVHYFCQYAANSAQALAGQAIAVRVTGDPDPANKACPEPVEGACFTCTATMLRRCSAQA